MQTFENVVGTNTVEAEAVTLVRSTDNTEVGTSTQPLRIDPTGTTIQPVSGTVIVSSATLNAARASVFTAAVSNNSTASGVSFIGSAGGSLHTDIITFIATNRSATATVVSLTDGTATYTFALAANGGIVVNFPTPLPGTSAATAWTIGNSATVACDYIAVYVKN